MQSPSIPPGADTPLQRLVTAFVDRLISDPLTTVCGVAVACCILLTPFGIIDKDKAMILAGIATAFGLTMTKSSSS